VTLMKGGQARLVGQPSVQVHGGQFGIMASARRKEHMPLAGP